MKLKKKKETKRVGRPPKDPALVKGKVNVSMRSDIREAGDALAYEEGVSLSELIERLIRKEDQRRRRRPE